MGEALVLYLPLSLLSLLLAFKLLLRTKARRKNLHPSPPSLPVIGHLHLLKLPIQQTFRKLSQKYVPVFSLWFGSRLVVVVSSPSAVEECLTKNDIVLANRAPLLLSKHLGYNCTTMASTPYGDHWRNLRRDGAIEIFSTKRLNAFTESRRDEVKRLLLKLSENSIQNFSKVKLQPMFEELTFNIVMRMVAGKRYYGDEVADEEEAMKFRETVKEAAAHGGAANPGDFLPVLNWVGLNGYEKSVVSLAKRMDELLQGLIDEQRRKKEEGKNTMIDHLLCLQESQPDYYNDKIIKGLILVMLLAGIDTSSVTLEWAMCNLLNHPSVLRKARAELDSQIGQERLVTELDMSNLPYLQGIISETLRLYPAAPLLLPHFSSDDCTVGEYDIPRGTIVLFNAWAMHRDPDLWTDPTSFDPERHGIDQENNSRMDSSVHKFIPFGLGRRACPGSGMAQRIVGLGLGSLIQCFEWERVSDEEIDMTEGKGLTMPKAVTLEAMCKIRPIMHKILKDTSNGV